MKIQAFSLFKNFKWLYILIIGLVTALTVAEGILILYSLDKYNSDARVINIAGRQRMLSQKLTKTVLLLNLTKNKNKQDELSKELQDTMNVWSKFHVGLQNGSQLLNLPGENSTEVMEMFTKLNLSYQNMIEATSVILKQKQKITQEIPIILANEGKFLEIMDRIVFQYELEANLRVKQLKFVEFTLMIITLSIMLSLLIFLTSRTT